MLCSLAIVNTTFRRNAGADEIAKSLRVNADFQNISSYVNPDVGNTLQLLDRHVEMLCDIPTAGLDFETIDAKEDGEGTGELGVPLLLPVTMNFDFEQLDGGDEPRKRSLAVNIDPLSVILSHQDTKLIHSVLMKWRSEQIRAETDQSSLTQPQLFFYDVVFPGQRLGLGLRMEGGQIAVDCIGDQPGYDVKASTVSLGDFLYAINGRTITNSSNLSLSDVVDLLKAAPRPLTVTFARLPGGQGMGRSASIASLRQIEKDDVYKGSVDSIDISLSEAILTLVEEDIPLFRGKLSATTASSSIERTSDTRFLINYNCILQLDYFNLRIWCWEPLLEPGCLSLSAAYFAPHIGPNDLTLEVSDRESGPLCLNITDAGAVALSKLIRWEQPPSYNASSRAISDYTTVAADIDNDDFGPSSDLFSGENILVSRKAVSAALFFAQRQTAESVKPFVFRNRTGASVAFVKQRSTRKAEVSERVEDSESFLGDYSGLHGYCSDEVTTVGSNEEVKFHVDVMINDGVAADEQGETKLDSDDKQFPFLTVALQAVAGLEFEPFLDLDLRQAGEKRLPLSLARSDSQGQDDQPAGQCLRWLVEQTDERTVVTLSSPMCIISLSPTPIEVGLLTDDPEDRPESLGWVQIGRPLLLPLWLCMQRKTYQCSLRPAGSYLFGSLFRILADGSIEPSSTKEDYIECPSENEADRNVWLSTVRQSDQGVMEITVDSCLSIRNVLPVSIHWEVNRNDIVFDGSILRQRSLSQGDDSSLKSGEYAEVFADGCTSMKARFRRQGQGAWSAWSSLALSHTPKGEALDTEAGAVSSDLIVPKTDGVVPIRIVDDFGVPLTFVLRIDKKPSGIMLTGICRAMDSELHLASPCFWLHERPDYWRT